MDAVIAFYSKTIIFPAVIFVIMLGLGLGLNLQLVRRVFSSPAALACGLIGQLIMLPLIAFGIAMLDFWAAYVALGLFVVALAPGGASSNAIVFALKGDIALSVSLTAISSLLSLLTIPVYLNLGLPFFDLSQSEAGVPVGNIMVDLALMTVLPVLLGAGIRHYRLDFANRILPKYRRIALIMLLFIIGLSIYSARETILDRASQIIVATILMAAIVVSLAYLAPKALGLGQTQQMAIAIEIGVQNTPIAIYIGSVILGQPKLAAVAIIYGLINYAFITALHFWLARSSRSAADQAPLPASVSHSITHISGE